MPPIVLAIATPIPTLSRIRDPRIRFSRTPVLLPMYHALLSNRYLTTRVIPLIAVAAVALCTALVIIVVSVMSGFVDMIRNAGKTLMGDVIVSRPIHGIPNYERLIAEIRALPAAAEASPVVDSWGLLKMPYEDTEVVQVWGVEPRSFSAVTSMDKALYWRPPTDAQWMAALRNATRELWELPSFFTREEREEIARFTRDPMRSALIGLAPPEQRAAIRDLPLDQFRASLPGLVGEFGWQDLWLREPRLRPESERHLDLRRLLEWGRQLRAPDGGLDAIITGIHVSKANERRSDGTYRVLAQGSLWMPAQQVTLTVLPVTDRGAVTDPQSRILTVVNEAQFGVFQIDDKRVLVPVELLQRMLELDASEIVDPNTLDPETGEPMVIGRRSARVTMILVSAKPGFTPQQLKQQVEEVYARLQTAMRAERVPDALPDRLFVGIKTWEEQNAQIIGPVEKERNLMRILFSIIYVVCAGLVLVIFWAIVYEKTKDIGILRSVGASRVGILWVFVRYGLVVGVIGSIIGLGLAYLVVRNINHIHNALGEPFPAWMWGSVYAAAAAALIITGWLATRGSILPVISMLLATIALLGVGGGMMVHPGFLVWDPKVYYFTEIPSRVDFVSAVGTMLGAVVFSVIGALIPAARAADFDPVAALRYE
ncbi:MAG: ABC transporter permease [Phycisphaeraceae bacterium]|nr:hypothetical protein [Phycisphaerales bacterium]QOJ18856.1 MAG: ABC transporter permease [Phycisphaeraceae bacterium]